MLADGDGGGEGPTEDRTVPVTVAVVDRIVPVVTALLLKTNWLKADDGDVGPRVRLSCERPTVAASLFSLGGGLLGDFDVLSLCSVAKSTFSGRADGPT